MALVVPGFSDVITHRLVMDGLMMCTYPGITSGILRMRLQFHLTLNQLRIPSTKELEICGWNKGCHQGR
jgi:hypothetical protein